MPIVRKKMCITKDPGSPEAKGASYIAKELVVDGEEWVIEAEPAAKRGKRKGDGAIDDSKAFALIKALIGQGTTTHAACESVASELGLSAAEISRVVNRWERKLRRERNE